MRDDKLLGELLGAETEDAVLAILDARGLLKPERRKFWRLLGKMANNQAIVNAQQSSVAAALVEKYTNAVDSILLRKCRTAGIDPRGKDAPATMAEAAERFLGDIDELEPEKLRALADSSIVLYATGRKDRPSLSLYDSGEGQLAKDFPRTFCSLIAVGEEGSYKRDVPFVQGQFNMGGTGVLPFCSEKRKLQLIVSRVPADIAGDDGHEWGYTLFCFFEEDAAWRYLIGDDGEVRTAGSNPLGLVPLTSSPKADQAPLPRARSVKSGTLIKMYDYNAPRSNVCGELYKKLEEYLLRPPLPMRVIECRKEYAANVMAVTVWDRLGKWKKRNKLETDFADGASFEIKLASNETVPGEIRVFRKNTTAEEDTPHTGVRALLNGQSHAKRDARFFRSKAVGLEHVADSVLVTLFCEKLRKSTRNDLFMSNRETFREDSLLLKELLEKLQVELCDHPALIELNERRYEEKVKDSVRDEDGVKALEELLATDPDLANLFGTLTSGTVAARTAKDGRGGTIIGPPQPFSGVDFPTYFHRAKDKATSINISVPRGDIARVSFITDVRSNYFTRRKPPRGEMKIAGNLAPSFSLFNGRLTFGCRADKKAVEGTKLSFVATITDKRGSGPFVLTVTATVVAPREEKPKGPVKDPRQPKVQAGPSQPNVDEQDLGPERPPLTIEQDPRTKRLKIILNKTCQLLVDAKKMRERAEEPAVEFVFKYGLALAAMGLIDATKKTDEWEKDESACRARIEQSCAGIARVIVPLCLSLPQRLPKPDRKPKSLAVAS